jgi:hypothetical protein
MYKLYSTGVRTEHCGTPAAIFLGEENLPSTETLNFLLVKNDATSLTRLAGNCTSDRLYSRPVMLACRTSYTFAARRRANEWAFELPW